MSAVSVISQEFELLTEKISDLVKTKKIHDSLLSHISEMKEKILELVKENQAPKVKKISKKSKKEENDAAPKKPLSGYMIFCKENREYFVKENPEASAKEMMSILGAEWKKLDDKSEYEQKALSMKKQYAEQMSQFEEKNPPKNEKKDENKRPLSPYILFCNEKRSEVKENYPDMKPVDITKKLGELWRGLSEEEQAEYKEKSLKNKE